MNHAAAQRVTEHAIDADDALNLLEMLGLYPEAWGMNLAVSIPTFHRSVNAEAQANKQTRPEPVRIPRVYQPCGTVAAYRRHRRAHETPCTPCRLAANESRRTFKAAAK